MESTETTTTDTLGALDAPDVEPAQPSRLTSDEPAIDQPSRSGRSGWPLPVAVGVVGLTALLAVPLVLGLVVLREPRWFPLTDIAHIELFVRDVGSTHTPLYGPIGRIYGFGAIGNHPGPLGFYALAPVYRLLGSDGLSLQAATVSVGMVAAAVAIWLGYRRGGWPFALAVTATLALLFRGYGPAILVEPWNPHLALVWWVVFLLAAWSVLCRDLVAVPVAVVAGSFCMQNHIAYIPLVGALTAVTGAALAVRLFRPRNRVGRGRRRSPAWTGSAVGRPTPTDSTGAPSTRPRRAIGAPTPTDSTDGPWPPRPDRTSDPSTRPDPTSDPSTRPDRMGGSRARAGSAIGLLAWVGGPAGLLAVLWLPPIVEQLTRPPGEPGNISLLAHHLGHPEALYYSLGEATQVWTSHLDVVDMAQGHLKKPVPWWEGSLDLAGLLLLATWLGTAVLARRRRDQAMMRLHVVVAVAAATGWLAFARLTGPPWPYLFYWAWGTTALMLLATAWTLLSLPTPSMSSTGAVRTPTLVRPGPPGSSARSALTAALEWAAVPAQAEPSPPPTDTDRNPSTDRASSELLVPPPPPGAQLGRTQRGTTAGPTSSEPSSLPAGTDRHRPGGRAVGEPLVAAPARGEWPSRTQPRTTAAPASSELSTTSSGIDRHPSGDEAVRQPLVAPPARGGWLSRTQLRMTAARTSSELSTASTGIDRHRSGDGAVRGPLVVPLLRWGRGGVAGLVAVALVSITLLAVDARHVEMDDGERSWTLGQVMEPTLERLAEDPAGCGDDCRVLVEWTDDVAMGAQALGLVAGLERAGIDARMVPEMAEQVRPHRVTRPEDADIEVHLAVDEPAIDAWRSRLDAELVASAGPRNPTEAEPIAVFLRVLTPADAM